MDKNQVIEFIRRQLDSGVITQQDLTNILGAESNTPQTVPQSVSQFSPQGGITENISKKPHDFTKILYTIGAIIAIIGVIILVAQNWDEIGPMGRILATAGISFITYASAFLLSTPDQHKLSQILFTISAALAPLGAVVLLDVGNIEMSLATQSVVALVLAISYSTAWFATKKYVLILFVIGFFSWAYYTFLLNALGTAVYSLDNTLKWASMLLATSYLTVGYGLSTLTAASSDADEVRSIQNILYGFGTLGVLGSGITIGGTFDLFYILIIFTVFYGSIYLKSRAMLIFGSLFLVGHIVKITAEYFVDSIGWPVALIVIGFLIVGIGYCTLKLNQRFFSK